MPSWSRTNSTVIGAVTRKVAPNTRANTAIDKGDWSTAIRPNTTTRAAKAAADAHAGPIRLKYGERIRIVLVNDTMMHHPIHLHGLWSDLEDEQGNFMVRKHTIDMPPGAVRSYRVTADALGRWAYHCHLLMHMDLGMFREVRVEE